MVNDDWVRISAGIMKTVIMPAFYGSRLDKDQSFCMILPCASPPRQPLRWHCNLSFLLNHSLLLPSLPFLKIPPKDFARSGLRSILATPHHYGFAHVAYLQTVNPFNIHGLKTNVA